MTFSVTWLRSRLRSSVNKSLRSRLRSKLTEKIEPKKLFKSQNIRNYWCMRNNNRITLTSITTKYIFPLHSFINPRNRDSPFWIRRNKRNGQKKIKIKSCLVVGFMIHVNPERRIYLNRIIDSPTSRISHYFIPSSNLIE